MPRLTRRVFTDLAIWMAAFGAAVGAVFPFFSIVLGTPAQVALAPPFVLACLGAGLLVGAVNVLLARQVVGTRVRTLARAMVVVRDRLGHAVETGDFSGCDAAECLVPVVSDDELGTAAAAFNALVEAVGRAYLVEAAIAAASTSVARQADPEVLAGTVLDAALSATGAVRGSVTRRQEGADEVLAHRRRPGRVPSRTVTSSVELQVGGRLGGHLSLDLAQPAPPGLTRLLDVLADTLAIALDNAELQALVQLQARTDDLTRLANRRAGLDRLSAELARAAVDGSATGVLLIDVDHFKRVNDTWGHQVGDELLRTLARVAEAGVRPGDLVCRYGGEEFLAVLSGADEEAVLLVAERLRTSIARCSVAGGDGEVTMTVSIGASSTGGGLLPGAELIGRADDALYRARPPAGTGSSSQVRRADRTAAARRSLGRGRRGRSAQRRSAGRSGGPGRCGRGTGLRAGGWVRRQGRELRDRPPPPRPQNRKRPTS